MTEAADHWTACGGGEMEMRHRIGPHGTRQLENVERILMVHLFTRCDEIWLDVSDG